jgi:hypothetical protein
MLQCSADESKGNSERTIQNTLRQQSKWYRFRDKKMKKEITKQQQ